MAKRRLLLTLEFLAISLPATWLWVAWGKEAYPRLFMHAVPALMNLLGYQGVQPTIIPDRFISFVPFFVLIMMTPRMSWKRRGVGTVVGFLAIFASHLAFATYVMVMQQSEVLAARPFRNIFPAFIALDAFPILVWVVIAKDFVSDFAARALPGLFGKQGDG